MTQNIPKELCKGLFNISDRFELVEYHSDGPIYKYTPTLTYEDGCWVLTDRDVKLYIKGKRFKVVVVYEDQEQWVLSLEEMQLWGDAVTETEDHDKLSVLFNEPAAPTVIPGITARGNRLKAIWKEMTKFVIPGGSE